MHIRFRLSIAALCASLLSSAVLADEQSGVVVPFKISEADAMGEIFQREDVTAETHPDGHQTESVTTMGSSDGRFHSGMYRSGKTRIEISQPYGVDEFMYFVKGSVTLTSSNGSVMTVNAGEAVTVPKEWTGIWETDGYEKIWVIYSTND